MDFRAVLGQPIRASQTGGQRISTDNLNWSCKGNICTARGAPAGLTVATCRALARRLGRIVGLRTADRSLSDGELRQCNLNAASTTILETNPTITITLGTGFIPSVQPPTLRLPQGPLITFPGTVIIPEAGGPSVANQREAGPNPDDFDRRPNPIPPIELPRCPNPIVLADLSLAIQPESVGATRSFPSVGAALDALVPGADCEVKILIAPGSYGEDLMAIPAHVTLEGLVGERPVLFGWIVIDDPVNVNLRNLVIVSPRHRAIDASNRATLLDLSNLWIFQSRDHGLRFGGRRLTANGILIQRTQGVESGSAGIYLYGGARATLVYVVLWANDGTGLIIDGPGSFVWARGLEITQTRVPRAWLDNCDPVETVRSIGAFVARNGALAEIVAQLRDNDLVGLQANTSGEIRLIEGTVDLTRELPDTDCSGGFGAAAGNGGLIDLRDFEISGSDLCGLVIQEGGAMDASDGTIARSPVGVCVQDADYDYSRVTDNVSYLDVGAPIQATSYRVPDASPENLD